MKNNKNRADTELARSIMRKKLENQQRQAFSMSPNTMLDNKQKRHPNHPGLMSPSFDDSKDALSPINISVISPTNNLILGQGSGGMMQIVDRNQDLESVLDKMSQSTTLFH